MESEDLLDIQFKEINRLADRGEVERALKRVESLYGRFPEHPRVIHSLGLLTYRNGDLEEGEALIRKALTFWPDYIDAYMNLALILQTANRLEEAENMLLEINSVTPDNPRQLSALAHIYVMREKYRQAFEICNEVLKTDPNRSEVFSDLGNICLALGDSESALHCYKKSIHKSGNFVAHSCLLFVLQLIPGVTQAEIYRESIKWDKRYTARLSRYGRFHFNYCDPARKLRIGYVSGDFRQHPVGYHLRPVLEAHDRHVVEVFLYDTSNKPDLVSDLFASLADHYRAIALLPDDKAESIIRRDGIDILIDLSGHTANMRLPLFARRPAPLQVTWLGYFNTTGMASMDYLIGDPITNPPVEDHLFSEKVIRLPHNRFCYQAPTYTPGVQPPPVLKNNYITFGSFNVAHKFSPLLISLWSRVLLSVHASRLVLKLRYVDEGIKMSLFEKFELNGVVRDRVEIRRRSSHAEMLAEYGDIDISLDTFPFNGGATTCESLWMGVPVVTLVGETPISRQSKAYLHTIGHPEWVAETEDKYIIIASTLASNNEKLNSIRMNLRQEMAASPLCDGKAFAADLEDVYRTIWKDWCLDDEKHVDEAKIAFRIYSTDELMAAGDLCLHDGAFDMAIKLYRIVIRRNPRNVAAHNNLGVVLKKILQFDDSIKSFKAAIRNESNNVDLYMNLANTLQSRGYLKQAHLVLRKGCAVLSNNSSILNMLGHVCMKLGLLKEGRTALEQVLDSNCADIEALTYLAPIKALYGDISTTLKLLNEAIILAPDKHQTISTLIGLMMYHEKTTQRELYELGRRFEKSLPHYGDGVQLAPMACKRHLRVGFVSPDFNDHPVGRLLSAFITNVDPVLLSIICFNKSGFRPDSMGLWYRTNVSKWHDIANFEDDELIDLIQKEDIDILVDLSGHTNNSTNCLTVFHRRAAPVQAAWIGYGHTTGLENMDYIIADHDFIREEDTKWFTEKPIYLPHNRFCFIPSVPTAEVVEPPCLDNEYITFGSFNNLLKISDDVIALWVRILKQVPKSRLILKYETFKDRDVKKYTLERFKQHGLPVHRIELRPSSTHYLMMIEYGDIDITLDPFPFTGGMTSLYSLWMGVPIISLAGELPISRQTKSFLDLLGLNDLVTYTRNDYVLKAVTLAKNPQRLTEIRETLRQIMLESPLCDVKKYSSDVSNLFFRMWKDRKNALAQDSI